jgi:signal transduction histidine kinase
LLVISAVTALLVVSGGLYDALRRRGRGKTGIRLFLAAFWLTVTTCAFVLPEALPAAALAHGMIITVGNATLGSRERQWLTSASMLALIGVVASAQIPTAARFPPLQRTAGMVVGASFGALALLATASVYRLMITQQRELLRQAQRDNAEIQEHVKAERMQRKRPEKQRERLQWTANELARSNQELQQFAYIASHDLQEPLRKIQAFGDRLRLRCAGGLDERGNDYLQRMQDAARRGQRRVNDLLAYSRVTTMGKPFVPVDLNRAARKAVSTLEPVIQRAGRRELNQALSERLGCAVGRALGGASLLDRVSQLMGQQFSAGRRPWRVTSLSKHDVPPHRVRARATPGLTRLPCRRYVPAPG